ncbi:MAG: potassium channel family protein, partial [Gemmataceae bacterium]
MDRPIVLCGLGRMGARVLDYLRAAGLPVVVIDTVCKPDDPRLAGATLVPGDCRRRETLERAGVGTARGVLLLTNDDQLNVSTALMCRSMNRDVRIVLRMFNQNLLARLGKAVQNVFALSTSRLTAPILAMTALTGQGLGTFRLDDTPAGLLQVVEVTAGPSLRGETLSALAARREVVVVAHLPAAGGPRTLLEVDPDQRIEAGDRVVLCGTPAQLGPLLTTADDEEQLRWANFGFRLLRMARRTVAEADPAVLICTLVVLAVLAVSTVVLRLGVAGYSEADAFLRTVSVMATGAPLREEDFKDAPVIRVYVSVLRLVGAVLIAAFTAIVTNYLLRARLGGVLEVRRIPESGHVIVCGLSTVGFRVTEELIRMGEKVVVIEKDANSRFAPTARRLGAAVMVGDASVPEVLKQAHAGAARAVVPATNSDMTNLEVALLVRELGDGVRVVLLINDPQFAEMLRDAADIRLALSVPALAAPAFVAGLFGDRVLSVFLLDARLYAALDLEIHDGDPFVGHALRALAVDYALLPVGLK